jgi:hypothetical protein
MVEVRLDTVEEAINYFGRENLVAISFTKQAIFYVKHGCQPVFVYPREDDDHKMVYWFKKTAETASLKKLWDSTQPPQRVKQNG